MNFSRSLILLSALWSAFAGAQFFNDEDELLEPEKAFSVQAEFSSPDTIKVEWNVAEGYYLYRDRIKFSTATPGVVLGNATFPKGKIKEDEFFGRMETYRHLVNIELPVKLNNVSGPVELKAKSQGCADIGVCYPPLTQLISLKPPATPTTSGGALSRLKELGTNFGLMHNDEPLPADEAFVFSSEARADGSVLLRWKITDGYYLYRDKFKLDVTSPTGTKIQDVTYPPGDIKQDEFFGRMEVYHGLLELPVKLQRENLSSQELKLAVAYQGCAEAGICYPPIKKSVSLDLPALTTTQTPASAVPADENYLPEQDRIASNLKTGSLWLVVSSFFGFGLLLAFTPCVFPMVPILSSIIVGQGEGISTRHAFSLSLIYVLAMALTYTAVGIIAGMFGANLQATFQNPWILSTFAVLFVLLALSMFGLYELQMPASIQSRLTEFSNRQHGGTYAGVAIMGFLSALIVGPCVAAPLAGALIYIGQTGDALLGGLALFALSMGMGAPLLAVGTGAGKLLPKAGHWMDVIKAVFGVLLLGLGIWMLERILPGWITMLLWAALVIISAVYMGAFDSTGPGSTGWRRLSKGAGLVLMIYGILLMLGAVTGGTNVWQPLQNLRGGFGTGAETSQTHIQFAQVKSGADLDREIRSAAQNGELVMLDFYADWCVSCKEMEEYTFSDPKVQAALSGIRLLQADVTANDATDKALLKRFKLIGPPSILFFAPDSAEMHNLRLVGFLKSADFINHIQRVKNVASATKANL